VKKRQLYDRTIGVKRLFAAVTMEVVPLGDSSEPTVSIDPDVRASGGLQSVEEVEVLLDCIKGALRRGPRGFPVAGIAVRVLAVERDGDTTGGAIQACAAIGLQKLLSGKSNALLEPLMALEVEVPSRFVGDSLSDLTVTRRAQIHDISSAENAEGPADISTITASVPLSTMLGYATSIRSITQGEGNFSMEFQEYSSPLDDNTVENILKGL
jgi:elongation factor G